MTPTPFKMATSRTTVRYLRALRSKPAFRRTYATDTQAPSNSHRNQALIGGLVGGGAVLTLAYGWYHFSGARSAVNGITETKAYFDNATKKFSSKAPEPNEALQWLRNTTLSYAAFIPGAKSYANSVFNDLDAVHEKHGKEVDEIVQKAYKELSGTVKDKGASVESAYQVWEILEKTMKDIGSLAGDAFEDILENHPDLKDKVGGNLSQLKHMGEKYGPEAQEQVQKTKEQIKSILSKGISISSANEIRKVIQEKVEMVRKMGDEAFQKGMEEVKPLLDKSPKVKEMIETNKDALNTGNVGQLWDMVKSAVNSGDTAELEKYVKDAADKAKSQGQSMGFDVEKYMNAVPGSKDVMSKLQQLQEIGQKHGKEAEDVLKSTVEEIKQVLKKKVEDAQQLADKAKKESK